MRAIQVGTVALAMALSSCSQATSANEADPAFDQFLDAVRADAEVEGASEAQLQLLEEARLEGEVTLDVVQRAQTETFSCFGDIDLRHSVEQPGNSETYEPPVYIFEDRGDELTLLADDCMTTHSLFVEMAYASQPNAETARRAILEQKLPEIVECLEDQGVAVPTDATADEVLQIVRVPIEDIAPLIEQGLPTPGDCMLDAGINQF